MGFENPFKKKAVKEGAIIAGSLAALGAAVEIGHHADELAHNMNRAPITAPAEVENPTLGMQSTDAPKAVTIDLGTRSTSIEIEESEKETISLGEPSNVSIDLGTVGTSIDMPKR